MKYLSATIILIGCLFANQTCKQPAMKNADIDWESESLLGPDDGLMGIGVAGAVTGIIGEFFILAGGANFPNGMPWDGGIKQYHDSGIVYRYSAGKAIDKAFTFRLSRPVAYAACISTPKGIVFAGGENKIGPCKTVGLLTVDARTKSVLIDSLPDLPYSATNASLALDGSTVYFVGGENRDTVHAGILALDLNSIETGWKRVSKMPESRTNSSVGCQKIDGVTNLIIVGGRQRQKNAPSKIFESVYRLDLANLNWKICAPFLTTIAAGSYLNLADAGLLLIGGDIGRLYQQTEVLIQAIENETDVSKKHILEGHRKKLQKSHPGFSNQVWLYQPSKDQWQELSEVPFPTPVTSTVIQIGQVILIPSGELKPGVRSTKLIVGRIPILNNEK
jgi:N-acetylneuraminic acid mutarotase